MVAKGFFWFADYFEFLQIVLRLNNKNTNNQLQDQLKLVSLLESTNYRFYVFIVSD